MRAFVALISCMLICITATAQQFAYKDSLEKFQQNYIATHEVVTGNKRSNFRFFAIDQQYNVVARFEKISDSTGFIMKTSGPKRSKYYRYGILYFRIRNTALKLTIYQSEQLMTNATYKDYLFVPFTDLGSGEKSYGGGRYLDFVMNDIRDNQLQVDFNKAYNPYCAYDTGFNCPIPPAENYLPVAIDAGEMEFALKH